jgi:tetratricopeptide (TPR) repeat protein
MTPKETRLEASTDPRHHKYIASFLTTWPYSELPDGERAAELATQAIKAAPSDGRFWLALGVARYRTGDWKGAIEALNKSMELRAGGDSIDRFFLAMAEWQLGNKDTAREWYDKAVEWMEKNSSRNEELIRFRAEAAELLGLSEAGTDR